jgi:hypothetical protein
LNVPKSGAAPSLCGHNVCSFVKKLHGANCVVDTDDDVETSSPTSPRSTKSWHRTKTGSSL